MSEQEPRTNERTSGASSTNDGDDVFFVTLQSKGVGYEVPVQREDPASTIFDFVHEVLDFPQENCKLIFKGKVVRLNDASQTVGDLGLVAGSKLMLMASTAKDVAFVQNSRADPLVKGFEEEERDERNRRKRARAAEASAWGTKQDAEYRFGSIKAEFKYSTPPPYEAEKLLNRLATDPGIIEIMKSRHFKVGVLTEMSPAEAQERMAKRGTPNMDLLGYNMNGGDMIVLRLRTDNVKGFRPYADLINTLIHELTHNVWGPHDHNFWKLFGELKAQYMRFHRFWSHNGKSADGQGGQFGGFSTGMGDDDEGADGGSGFGRTLGGREGDGDGLAAPVSEAERRERALLAAEARKVTAELPKPNFLAGNGTWVIMCPCGQTHELADCPNGGKAPVKEDEDEDEDDDEDEVVAAKNKVEVASEVTPAVTSTDKDAEPASSGVASSSQVPQQTNTSVTDEKSIQEEKPDEKSSEAVESRSNDAQADSGKRDDASAKIKDTTTPGPTDGQCVDKAAADTVKSAEEAAEVAPALSASELESLGLDGASLWLQRFGEQLRALRGGAEQKRPGLELLLKLVRNVVLNPSEPKFRRIRADNPRIRADLLGPGGCGIEAEALMQLLGFEAMTESSGERVFLLRDATFDTVRLRMGQEMLENELKGGRPVA
eukprot:TRINITY_DN7831_c0_g1_i1.p1 TRINITY_DN7831_c0_g1~~TRINITY_DN7831_c0_g1_i1.p1  ORF type:complete len:660 (+),score=131.12 TRINITY_DN7831_c0_g1_i1:73-2052(+)